MAVTLAPIAVPAGRKNMRKGQPYPLPAGPRRATGTNPRALGTNPRAKGTNPRAFAADGTSARAAQTRITKDQAARRALVRQNRASALAASSGAGSEAHSAPRANPTVVVDGAAMELSRAGGLAAIRSIRAEQLAPLLEQEGGEPP